ncbi:MAG: hypothetical protein AVDCRST_MAG88-1693, partial [uncultured Thermomicrobiales bacterium]
ATGIEHRTGRAAGGSDGASGSGRRGSRRRQAPGARARGGLCRRRPRPGQPVRMQLHGLVGPQRAHPRRAPESRPQALRRPLPSRGGRAQGPRAHPGGHAARRVRGPRRSTGDRVRL